MKKVIYVLMICLFINLIIAQAQKIDEQSQDPVSSKQSKFKKLYDIKDAIVITEQYEIVDYKANDLRAFASVGWLDGETKKIYAANIGNIFIDFEQLDTLQNELAKIIQKIEKSYVENKLISIRYISPDGVFINYYTFRDDKGNLLRNVYFKYGIHSSQEKTTEQIKKFSNLITQIREKLILLGAKRQSDISKK